MTQYRIFKITCSVCGAIVTKNNKQDTCSMVCRSALFTKRRLEKAPVAPCDYCGETKPLIIKAKAFRLCSKRCRNNAYSGFYHRKARNSTALAKIRYKPEEKLCVMCQSPFINSRYDQKCCSTRCTDNFAYHYGNKGKNIKAKHLAERNAKNVEIGKCALCKTKHHDIKPPIELGRESKSGVAKFHKDHILPKTKGGSDADANRRYLCWFCNLSRMDIDSKYDHAIAAAGTAFWKAINS